jgi:fucose permease
VNKEAALIAVLTTGGGCVGFMFGLILHHLGVMPVKQPLLALIGIVLGVVVWWILAREIYYALKHLNASKGGQ